jgi:hypothetical protein
MAFPKVKKRFAQGQGRLVLKQEATIVGKNARWSITAIAPSNDQKSASIGNTIKPPLGAGML